VTRRLIGHFAADLRTDRQRVARERLAALTDREREVLAVVARGLSNADIGRELFMSEATVKAHVSRLLVKLDAANRVQVAILAHDAGYSTSRQPAKGKPVARCREGWGQQHTTGFGSASQGGGR
jgi:DNA-binding NarL/FixJ family response regulator